jgi:hypothetical protein
MTYQLNDISVLVKGFSRDSGRHGQDHDGVRKERQSQSVKRAFRYRFAWML